MVEIDLAEIKFSKHPLHVPEAALQVQQLDVPVVKAPQIILTESDVDTILDQEVADIGNQVSCSAEAKDLAFSIYRSNTDRHSDMKSNYNRTDAIAKC